MTLDPWDESDPVRLDHTRSVLAPTTELPPRLAELRDGAPAATDPSPARLERIARLRAEHADYRQAMDEFDRMLDHVRTCPDVSVAVMGVVETHIVERRSRIIEKWWSSIGRELDAIGGRS